MQKVPSLFKRDYEGTKKVYDEVVEGSEWVLAGEGTATRKWDGTSCRIRGGFLYRRHRVKEGKAVPPGWIHWDDDPAQQSGHGWVPVGDGSADQYHREVDISGLDDGTYELCGPSIQKNPEGFENYALVRHGKLTLVSCPRTFKGLQGFLNGRGIEGVVWHHPDGRMVKIKAKDFEGCSR